MKPAVALSALALLVTPALAADTWLQQHPAVAGSEHARGPGGWTAIPTQPPARENAPGAPEADAIQCARYPGLRRCQHGNLTPARLPAGRLDPKTGYVDPKSVLVLPPKEFDHPYKGDLTIVKTAMKHVEEQCPPMQAGFPPIGCSFFDGYAGGRPNTYCRIVIALDAEIRAMGWTPDVIFRHEQAHCNGWPANHPGARASLGPEQQPSAPATTKQPPQGDEPPGAPDKTQDPFYSAPRGTTAPSQQDQDAMRALGNALAKGMPPLELMAEIDAARHYSRQPAQPGARGKIAEITKEKIAGVIEEKYECQETEVVEDISTGKPRTLTPERDLVLIEVANNPPRMKVSHVDKKGRVADRNKQYQNGSYVLLSTDLPEHPDPDDAEMASPVFSLYGSRTVGSTIYRIVGKMTLDWESPLYYEEIHKNGYLDATIRAGHCSERK